MAIRTLQKNAATVNLKDHYNNLWNQSLQKFRSNEFELDPLIDSENDHRYGVTLLARPSEELKKNISTILDQIRTAAPHQYYYPESDLHVTILSIIPCYSGFSLNQIDPTEHAEIVQSAIDLVSPFEITFRGLTASPSCILVQGFPRGDQLNVLRNELREKFKDTSLHQSIDKRYQLQTAHMTVVRFRKSLKSAEKFISEITELRDSVFGSCIVDQVDLVGNDWYQRQNKVETIAKFYLGK